MISLPFDQFDRTISGHRLPHDEQVVRDQFRAYVERLPRHERIRWDLRNASQRLALAGKGFRRARREYQAALAIIGNPAWIKTKQDTMNLRNVERIERALVVAELRWKRDRTMSPLGAALFGMMNSLTAELYGPGK